MSAGIFPGLLTQLLDTTYESVVITDEKGLIVGWNRGAEHLHGMSANAMLGKNYASVCTNLTPDTLQAKAIALAGGEGREEFAGRIRTGSGDVLEVRTRLTLLRDLGAGRSAMVFASMGAQHATSHPLVLMPRPAADPNFGGSAGRILCACLDAEQRYLHVNDAYADYLGGIASDALIGHRIQEVLGPVAYASWSPFLERALGGESVSTEALLSHADGSTHRYALYVVPEPGRTSPPGGCRIVAVSLMEPHRTRDTMLKLEQELRETLVRDVHRRVKNSLQGIVGLMRNRTIADPQLAHAMDPAIAQLMAVAVGFGLSSQAGRPYLLLCDLVREVTANVAGMSAQGVSSRLSERVQSHPVRVHPSEAVNISLVINELIFNAVRHGSGAEVRVELSRDDYIATLRILSPAAHLPADFDLDSGTRLKSGLRLVKTLLPPQSTSLSLINTHHGVLTELRLWSPTISPNSSAAGTHLTH